MKETDREAKALWDFMGNVQNQETYRTMIKPQWKRCDVLRNKRCATIRHSIVQRFRETGKLWSASQHKFVEV